MLGKWFDFSVQLVTHDKLTREQKKVVTSKKGYFLITVDSKRKKITRYGDLKQALKAFLRLKHPEIDDLKLQRITNDRIKKIHPTELYLH